MHQFNQRLIFLLLLLIMLLYSNKANSQELDSLSNFEIGLVFLIGKNDDYGLNCRYHINDKYSVNTAVLFDYLAKFKNHFDVDTRIRVNYALYNRRRFRGNIGLESGLISSFEKDTKFWNYSSSIGFPLTFDFKLTKKLSLEFGTSLTWYHSWQSQSDSFYTGHRAGVYYRI